MFNGLCSGFWKRDRNPDDEITPAPKKAKPGGKAIFFGNTGAAEMQKAFRDSEGDLPVPAWPKDQVKLYKQMINAKGEEKDDDDDEVAEVTPNKNVKERV